MKINKTTRIAYENLEWGALLRNDLGSAGSLSAAEANLTRIKAAFDRILHHPVLATLAPEAIQEIENEVTDFIFFAQNNIRSFSDVSLRNLKIEEIKARERQILERLAKYFSYFIVTTPTASGEANVEMQAFVDLRNEIRSERQNSIEARAGLEKRFNELVAGLEPAEKIANELVGKAELIGLATSRAEELIKKNEESIQLILRSNATSAAKKANEHKTYSCNWVPINRWVDRVGWLRWIKQPSWHGSFTWLILALVFGAIVMTIVGYFILYSANTTIAGAILRISAIAVPIYFTIFCAHQYLSHRRLHEAYSFKDIALQTMVNLRNQIPNEGDAHDLILKKSLDVLFNEPSFKDEIKLDKQLAVEVFKLLKKENR